ncbi:FAD-dependent oxidoreductase [Comamonas sp. w2-DMI]|uniref:FAD-dependent oxidoreductase n=1 Tax=Comamonas sp. w2-DMI TaxID=3126391 RepID=UPI0032E3FE06
MDQPLNRRRALLTLGAAGAAGIALTPGIANAANKVKTTARIVIAGAGAAGLAAASRLSEALDGAKITLIDARKEHFYQPGFTLVGSGIKPAGYVVSTTAEYVPAGVELVQERVAEFDPEGKKVVTESGEAHAYDFLVVATGMKLEYGLIEGMEEGLIGKNGIGSIYHSPAKAEATWQDPPAPQLDLHREHDARCVELAGGWVRSDPGGGHLSVHRWRHDLLHDRTGLGAGRCRYLPGMLDHLRGCFRWAFRRADHACASDFQLDLSRSLLAQVPRAVVQRPGHFYVEPVVCRDPLPRRRHNEGEPLACPRPSPPTLPSSELALPVSRLSANCVASACPPF